MFWMEESERFRTILVSSYSSGKFKTERAVHFDGSLGDLKRVYSEMQARDRKNFLQDPVFICLKYFIGRTWTNETIIPSKVRHVQEMVRFHVNAGEGQISGPSIELTKRISWLPDGFISQKDLRPCSQYFGFYVQEELGWHCNGEQLCVLIFEYLLVTNEKDEVTEKVEIETEKKQAKMDKWCCTIS